MISRLLIANRGEIARRVARAAAAMGIETVAVYSEGDRLSPHVADCDRAVALQGRRAADTYLNVEALVAAALSSEADAVHPGYGFLSERAAFAQAVTDAGLTWVGPPPDVIAAMGDKLAAKRIMAEAGVPVLPSWTAGDDLPDGVQPPVLVKAAAGGGGRGMRVVERAADLTEALGAAGREAAAAFGDATVFVEPYVTGARHVEVQILGDDHGHLIHCLERDCSVQRRHQKLIEECPSPAVDAALRQRLTDAALAAGRAVGYRSAGTVEFVVAPSGQFWFLEVNTRLQVEHPVTEEVIGLDLVREQLRVAAGLPLSVTQDQVKATTHAVEARLYAEDAGAGFLPSTGRLLDWAPAARPGVRWESGVEAGTEVGVDFDPLLAKVVARGPTRQEAAAALARALAATRVRGVVTNRDFLVAALLHPQFLAGAATTDFVESSGVARVRPVPRAEVRDAVVAAALWRQAERRGEAAVLASLPSGWRNSAMPAQQERFRHRDEEVVVDYRHRGGGRFEVAAGGDESVVELVGRWGGWADLEEGGRRWRAHVVAAGDRVWVQGPGGDVALEVVPRFPAARVTVAAGALVAPLPGTVLRVAVAEGDTVAGGQLLVVVEAMKMEHRVTAPRPGTVSELRARAGDQVAAGDLLAVVE